MKIIGVIPARYASSRFPGKPLADIHGKPMIWWVYQQAKKVSRFEEVYVAVDDERIYNAVNSFGGKALMTSPEHSTAIYRMFDISERIVADFYVQINGDEPLISPTVINEVIPTIVPQNIEFGTNIITETLDAAQTIDPSNIKVTFDTNMNALYMSRSPIPFPFNSINFKYYKHVGIIGYNKKMLDSYNRSEPGIFERTEGLDLMRIIECGMTLKLIYCEGIQTLSVDTPKDLVMIRDKMIKENNL